MGIEDATTIVTIEGAKDTTKKIDTSRVSGFLAGFPLQRTSEATRNMAGRVSAALSEASNLSIVPGGDPIPGRNGWQYSLSPDGNTIEISDLPGDQHTFSGKLSLDRASFSVTTPMGKDLYGREQYRTEEINVIPQSQAIRYREKTTHRAASSGQNDAVDIGGFDYELRNSEVVGKYIPTATELPPERAI